MKAIHIILSIAILLLTAIPSAAATLIWNPSTGTVDGYGVYYWPSDKAAPQGLADAHSLDYVGHVHTHQNAAVGIEVTQAILDAHPKWKPEYLGARMYDLSGLALRPGAEYQFAVSAYNAAGESEMCDPVRYAVPGYLPPDVRILESALVIPAGATIIVIER